MMRAPLLPLRRSFRIAVGLVVGLSLGACTPEVPTSPSFQLDVMPILAANCVRCHGVPAIGGAPEWFRLDVFADMVVTEAPLPPDDPACMPTPPTPKAAGCFPIEVLGAGSLAPTIAERAGDADRPMPPRFPLADHQIELLEVWQATRDRGAARPQNRPPTAVIDSIEPLGDERRIVVRVDDPDGDLAGGVLQVRVLGQARAIGALAPGRSEIRWDTTGVAAGSYPLVGQLDDGAQLHELELGTITIGGR